jgi:hypothetical protein
MAKWKFNKLTNLSHLLAAATDIVISDIVEVTLLVLTLDRLALTVDNSVLCNNAVLWRVDFDDLELNLTHTSTHGEEIALTHWSVGFAEVWGKEDVKERAGQTLNGICDGEDGNSFGLFHEIY